MFLTSSFVILSVVLVILSLAKDLYGGTENANKGILCLWLRMTALSFLLFSFTPAQANILDWRLWSADSKLKAEKFSEAKDEYLKIQVKEPDNARLNYNLGIANYREGDMVQAMNSFQLASTQAKETKLQEKAFYNLGNSQFKLQNYEAAISSYEFALELDPGDEDAKHNLELAKKKLEEQKQDKQNQDQDQDKKDDQGKDGDKKEDDQKNDSDDKQDDQDKKDQDDQKNDQNKPQNNQSQPQNRPNKPKDDSKEGGLTEKDINMMLMQVEEADPSEVNQNRALQRGSGQNKNLKPW